MSKAIELFTAVPKLHNCAQAVVCGAGRGDLYDDMARCGGGKAPDGCCGALYGAKLLSAHPEEIAAAFVSELGASSCHELKQVKSIPCQRCVELAAKLLEEFK